MPAGRGFRAASGDTERYNNRAAPPTKRNKTSIRRSMTSAALCNSPTSDIHHDRQQSIRLDEFRLHTFVDVSRRRTDPSGCHRVSLPLERTKSQMERMGTRLLSTGKERERLVRSWIAPRGGSVHLEIDGKQVVAAASDIHENRWYHICLSWESEAGRYGLWLDGRLRARGRSVEVRSIEFFPQTFCIWQQNLKRNWS